MEVTTLEVHGLTGKAENASGSYTLSGKVREYHAVYTQEEGDARGHEISHDGVGTLCTHSLTALQRVLSRMLRGCSSIRIILPASPPPTTHGGYAKIR